MSDGNIENLTYRDRCCLSNSNPVLVARLTIILFAKNSKFLAHYMRIVFCGLSTHVAFVDQIVHAFLPVKHGN